MVKWSESEFAQLCLTLCDPMDSSLPGSSVHGIFQARVLEWVTMSFSRGSSWPRDWTQVSCTAGRHFTLWATREAHRVFLIRHYHLFVQGWSKSQKIFSWNLMNVIWNLSGQHRIEKIMLNTGQSTVISCWLIKSFLNLG